MVRVDATHALLLTQLYAGTDLRYKYTLGDGLWNAERDANGGFVTRQLIVPEQGPVVQDTVASWRSPAYAGLTFHVTVPANTPASDFGQHPVQSVHMVRADPDVEGSRRDVDLRAQWPARLRRRTGLPLLPQPAVRVGG